MPGSAPDRQQQQSPVFAGGGATARFDAKWSILPAAPARICLPTSMAARISASVAPHSLALAARTSRHDWQFAVMLAPTAMSPLTFHRA